MSWQTYNPENPINPDDYMGQFHNELLEFFVNNVDEICDDPELDSAPTMLTDTATLLIPKVIELLNITPTIEEKNTAFGACILAVTRPCDRRNLFMDISEFSTEFQTIWNSIKSEVNNLTVSNINNILTNLKGIDTTIQNSSLVQLEKTSAFQINSIARFSSAYWVNEKLNPNSPWIEISADRGGEYAMKDPPDWVYADIEGALIGAWFTANPFVALGGGAATSAYHAAKKAYKKKCGTT
ncbi:MAG: hypothetical protein HOD63_03350 [Bacteroidetes bacterium]|jgi:hypothetical protein|nr:hypothetical protein [Bacteroidota bacterium]MBT5530314.1 hypothetical protein [Cytophagia bacterium]MBT3421578.1 hypothetical protein [Bacteroidota bacterium]MBT3934128.1 hypothetical protein [Bacteroidota bacterium]MBT4337603.1 hypothetical protein [Bacteroidota bacterium]